MKRYYVLWTYEANYSELIRLEAEDEKDAYLRATYLYQKNANFIKKAKIYVFDKEPVAVYTMGEKL